MSHLGGVLLLHLHDVSLATAALNSLLAGYPVLGACVCMRVDPALDFLESVISLQLVSPSMANSLRGLSRECTEYSAGVSLLKSKHVIQHVIHWDHFWEVCSPKFPISISFLWRTQVAEIHTRF